MTMAGRIAVMHEGRIAQIGTPPEIYETPNSRLVASFVGAVNLFEGRLEGRDGAQALVRNQALGELRLDACPEAVDPLWVAVRPEKIRLSREEPPQAFNKAAGVIAEIGYLGDASAYRVRLPCGLILRAAAPNRERRSEASLARGEPVWLSWSAEAGVALTR